MVDYENIVEDINRYLLKYLNCKISQANNLDSSYKDLWLLIKKNVNYGGKRSRPYLTILTYLSLCKKSSQDILEIAVSQELLHIALLIHDDIIDEDYTRHNKANIAGQKFKDYSFLTNEIQAYHLANSVSLLAGDLLISAAYELIINSKVSLSDKIKIMKILTTDIFEVAGGELFDIEAVLKPFDSDFSFKISRYKTAGYSFYYPMLIGAVLAKANEKQLALIKKFSYLVGIAYQLIDDDEGLFGQEKIIGKSVLSDLKQGKRTYLMSLVFQLCSVVDREYLNKIFKQSKIASQQHLKIKNIAEKCGARAQAKKQILDLINQARLCLNQFKIDKAYKVSYQNFLDNLIKRVY